jgi:hypothetical protein
LVEPTIRNFKRLRSNYEKLSAKATNMNITFANAAVCSDCCYANKTTQIFHPRWADLDKEREDTRRSHPELFHADGTWFAEFLFELASLDRKSLERNRPGVSIDGTWIGCFATKDIISSYLPGAAQTPVDLLVVDVEGFDFEVLKGLLKDSNEVQRPKLIVYEEKMIPDAMGAKRFLRARGYEVAQAAENGEAVLTAIAKELRAGTCVP